MDRERFEQLKQKENEILRGRPVGGVVNGYGADNGLTPEQTIGFINKQSVADEDWKAAKAFYNGSVNQLERGILGTLAMIKDNNIASLQAQGIAVGDGGKYIDMALNSEHLQPYEVKGKTALGQFGLDLASGAGQLVSQAALALTTGGVGSTVAMGASIAGNQYADLRKEGVSVERATNASLINAAVQAPLERLSIGNILSKLPAGSGMRQKAIQIAQNAVTEGVTEYVQQYPEEITNLYAKSGGNLEELANATIDKLPEIHQNALYAGAIGALLGGGAGTINVALQRNINTAQLEAVEGRVEQAKQIGITPEAYANTVNNNLPDSNVSVDGDVLLKFMQSGKTEEIAQSLGVTVNEVQQAADEGLTVEIRQGNYEGTAMKYADFMPAVRDYSAFEVNGFMQSDTQGQKELQKEYQQFTDNEEEFLAYKDEKIAEMQAAGINQQEALNAMILLESRARVYNPDNPLAFFEAYPIEFRRGTDGGEFNQPEVLDNDTANLRSIQKALEKYNYVAVRGLTGVNAKKKYRKGQRLAPSIDDPDGRGIEFHPELPKLPGTSGIPVSQLMYDDELLKMIEAARQYGENGRIALIAGDSAVDGSDVRETVIKNAKFLGYLDEGKVLEMPGEKAEKKKKPHTTIFSKQDVADYRNMVLDRVVKQYPNLNRLFAWEQASFEERDTYTNLDNYVSQENEKWLKDIDVNKVKKELEEYKSTNVYNQSAYHGTPHSFEQFDLGAIGTGEGAQAHGWGLYFAADKKIADERYRKRLTNDQYVIETDEATYYFDIEKQDWVDKKTGQPVGGMSTPLGHAVWEIGFREGNVQAALKALKGQRDALIEENDSSNAQRLDFLIRTIKLLEEKKFNYRKDNGSLFEVDIPENDVLLDEDKSIEEQPSKVREIIEKELERIGSSASNGKQFYNEIVFEFARQGSENPQRAASEYLNRLGIKGITYEGARDGRCFVIFDDKAISIINRYNQSVGIHARTANRELLNEAQAMAAEGKMQREIYEKTGWRRGADGKWRFEIPDNLDKIDIKKLQSTKQFFTLGEIYDNKKLYEAYPFLREVTIQKEKLDGNRLGYSEGDYLIVIDSDVDEWFTPGTIIHELQHIIQNYEGFASGGNTRQVRTLVNEAIRKKTEEARSLAPHATMYYNRRREYEMAMIMGDEARMKELEGPIKKLEQEIPNKARRDRIYKLFSEADSLLRKANNMSDKQLYINLYGEKEARAAEEKARISTRMERNRQKGNTQYDEILRDYTERLPEELQLVAKEYVDLIKRPLAERDFDRETEIEEKLLDNEIAGEFYNKISDSQWEAAGTGELQKEYDETVFLPEKADAVVIFNDNLVASYNENTNEGNRGSIWWNNDGAAIVELFSAADASTFIHESIGHYFANVLAKEAVLPGANEQTVKDFETMLDYAGTTRERWEYLNSKPRPALTKDEDKELVKIQETWATAAEQYILEGKAPNRELQPVFNRFKKWLINVYKTIESFVKNNQYAVPITDEVRQVFDRMLASEQQISEMEKLNGYYAKLPKAITDNLSDAYKTRLYDAMAKAHDKAVQLLTRKSLENFTAERKEQIAEYRADMRPKVAAQVDNEPLYRAEKEAADMITSGGKQPKTIARRYIDSNAQEYKDWKSELDRVQSDINSRLDPIIQALEAGMGNGVAKVRDDATGRYIRISNNDPWYSDFYKTYKRRPTKAELRDMAYKIYVGEGYNLLPDSVARNADEEAAYAELKEDIDGLMEYEEELLSYKGEMEQYKGKGLSDEDAYTFDMLAEEYGFSSGDDLAKAILESPTRQQAIKQRLDDEVQKKFPDIYKERRLAEAAAQEAFYNDDTGAVLGLEEQIIEDAAKRTLDQQRNAEQQRQLAQMKRQQAKVQAQGYLRSVPLREALRIQKYITAERRAAANAATALAKGDYETALDYKHKQLLNHAMVQESINMNRRYTQYGKFLNRQRKLKKESWNNEENFMQVGALFARMGLRLRGYDARLKQQSLKEWADAMQADYDNVAIPDWVYDESRTFTRPLSDLTFDEYEDVVNALKNIKAVVKAQTMMEGEAKAQTFADTKAAGMAAIGKLPTKYTPDVNEKGKAGAFEKFKRQLRNSDNFFEMIDGWTYGWYSKFFGETVRKAADVEAELTMQYEDATRQAYKEWLPDKAARKAANAKVKYDELGTSATKHTLIYMALNLGNESNAAKLCSTAVNSTFRKFFPQSQLWVEGDVIQTKKNLLEFLGRNLTVADWRYVQKKIDIANMFWPQMSELERRDKGFAPPKVEAYPEIITLADGQQIVYRGGYFPLIRRRDTGSHPASQDAIPATTGGRPGDSIRTLHTNTGHTKARDNSVYPIDLTGGGEYAVAMDTIHDIAFREPMNNFRKLINDSEFYNMLKSKLGIADMEALEEFLKKAAQPYGGSGFATLSERDTGKFMSWLRNKTVNAAIMLNFKTSLQNLGNPLLYGRVVDGFGYADVLAAYANYQKNWQGRKGFHAMRDFVYSKSVFMRERGQLPDISLRDMKDEGTELNPIEKRTIKWGTQVLTFTDELSALPVWIQAYQKKINAKASEQEAKQFADTVIRRTLGSSRITDVAPIQRGGPLMKLLTTFQGFFNTQYNQWNREFNIVTRLIKEGSYGTAAGRVTAFAASKFLLFNLLNLALALENPFDDDDDDGWPKIATELLHYPISLLGPVGGIANATLNNMLGIRDYGYNMTAIEGSLDKLFKAGKLVDEIADGDKDVEEAVEPVAGVATMAAGIPNQLNKLFFNAWDILYNDMDAEWRDLFYRRPARDR